MSKVRRSRSLRQWPAVPRPSSSLSSPPSVSPFSSSSSNRQSLARRWTRDKYRRHGIGASSFFPASSANTTTGLAREGQIRFFHPLGFLFLFFLFFFFRGTKRSSQEVVDIVGGAVSGKGWGTRLDGDGMERSHKPFYKGTKSIPPGVPRFCNETGICMLLWTRKLSEMAARRSLSDLL